MNGFNAYKVAEQLQCRRDKPFFCASDILGSDWASGFNGFKNADHYKSVVLERAESIYGSLPFNPYED